MIPKVEGEGGVGVLNSKLSHIETRQKFSTIPAR